ncbi:MAG: RNA polymerase alpha subunit C-terminal domain-containing protein [Chitinophagaceae bacterium]
MAISAKTLRTCSKGHQYYKSSDCPVCPVCAAAEKPEDAFLSRLVAPARRALQNAGITTVKKLSHYTEAEILNFHGIGPSSIPVLRSILQENGLSFKKQKSA